MSYEANEYAEKRVRQEGTREWKLWFNNDGVTLLFRILTKDTATDCYESLSGEAVSLGTEDLVVKEDDNGNAYHAELFRYQDDTGRLTFCLEAGSAELVWVKAKEGYAGECGFDCDGPLMPEIAG